MSNTERNALFDRLADLVMDLDSAALFVSGDLVTLEVDLVGAAALADRLEQAERDKAAVERVRERHRRVGDFCKHCVNPWPCPTTRALDGTEAGR